MLKELSIQYQVVVKKNIIKLNRNNYLFETCWYINCDTYSRADLNKDSTSLFGSFFFGGPKTCWPLLKQAKK